jgi:hypothetical protein
LGVCHQCIFQTGFSVAEDVRFFFLTVDETLHTRSQGAYNRAGKRERARRSMCDAEDWEEVCRNE